MLWMVVVYSTEKSTNPYPILIVFHNRIHGVIGETPRIIFFMKYVGGFTRVDFMYDEATFCSNPELIFVYLRYFPYIEWFVADIFNNVLCFFTVPIPFVNAMMGRPNPDVVVIVYKQFFHPARELFAIGKCILFSTINIANTFL